MEPCLKSKAYQGTFALAAIVYFIAAITVVAYDPKGILAPLIYYGVQMGLYQPVLQFSWLFCSFWLGKLPLCDWATTLARRIAFSSVFSLSISGIIPTPFTRPSIDDNGVVVSFDLNYYYVLVFMAVYVIHNTVYLSLEFKFAQRPVRDRNLNRLIFCFLFVCTAATGIWTSAFLGVHLVPEFSIPLSTCSICLLVIMWYLNQRRSTLPNWLNEPLDSGPFILMSLYDCIGLFWTPLVLLSVIFAPFSALILSITLGLGKLPGRPVLVSQSGIV